MSRISESTNHKTFSFSSEKLYASSGKMFIHFWGQIFFFSHHFILSEVMKSNKEKNLIHLHNKFEACWWFVLIASTRFSYDDSSADVTWVQK